MNETTLSKENMEATRLLAKVNMEISDARNLLFKLQEDETKYLEAREVKALGKIQKALDDSKEILNQIKSNQSEVHEFCNTVIGYATFLRESHRKFQDMIEAFNKKNEIWDSNMKIQQKEMSEIKKEIKRDQEDLAQQKIDIKAKEKRLSEEKDLIESRQAALQNTYKVEKALWDKLNSK